LEKAGKIYPLTASRGDSGYYHYAGNDLAVNAGDLFKISVTHNGQRATAETTIPYWETPEQLQNFCFQNFIPNLRASPSRCG
jgi:hypothetical protein